MNILLACEESNEVAGRLRAKGHFVISCDMQRNRVDQTYHYKGDVRDILHGYCSGLTFGEVIRWDMLIGFPPCTHLAVSGAKHFHKKEKQQEDAIQFFLLLAQAEHIPKRAIENPVGIMSSIYRQPDQIIHPYYFGDSYQKTTCLWLTKLPKLFHARQPDLFTTEATHVDRGEMHTTSGGNVIPKWYTEAKKSSKAATSKTRSKTFPGIAQAMADQWG